MTDGTIRPIPGKVSNKTYETQGWNAAQAGHRDDACPYYATSTAAKYWLKGHHSVQGGNAAWKA